MYDMQFPRHPNTWWGSVFESPNISWGAAFRGSKHRFPQGIWRILDDGWKTTSFGVGDDLFLRAMLVFRECKSLRSTRINPLLIDHRWIFQSLYQHPTFNHWRKIHRKNPRKHQHLHLPFSSPGFLCKLGPCDRYKTSSGAPKCGRK